MNASTIIKMAILFVTLSMTQIAFGESDDQGLEYVCLHKVIGDSMVKTDMFVTFTSSIPGVNPTDMVFTIHSTNGDIAWRVDQKGVAVDFPMDERLLAENPRVTHNQPAGSVEMKALWQMESSRAQLIEDEVKAGIDLTKGKVRYQALHLVSGRLPRWRIEDATTNIVMDKIAADPVTLTRLEATNGALRIRLGKRKTTVWPENGVLRVPASTNLWRCNPWITFSPALDTNWMLSIADGTTVPLYEHLLKFINSNQETGTNP